MGGICYENVHAPFTYIPVKGNFRRILRKLNIRHKNRYIYCYYSQFQHNNITDRPVVASCLLKSPKSPHYGSTITYPSRAHLDLFPKTLFNTNTRIFWEHPSRILSISCILRSRKRYRNTTKKSKMPA